MKFLKVVIFIFMQCSILYGQNAVTYNLGGRFGDCLLSYLHAKWISYQYGLPLLYQPFKYSDELILDEKEISIANCKQSFNKKIKVLNAKTFEKGLNLSLNSTLFIIPYFPEKLFGRERPEGKATPYFEANWQDKKFRDLVKKLVLPKKEIQTVALSKNCVNIAIHVREGGGFDAKNIAQQYPTKLPPMSFYKEGLSRVIALFPGKDLYCYIFTDSTHPDEIARQFQEFIGNNEKVKFGWRKENNSHDANVLEDFFSFFKFDVLIRPQSNYSFVPTLIHDFAVVFSPHSATIKGQNIVIDKFDLVINEELYKKLTKTN